MTRVNVNLRVITTAADEFYADIVRISKVSRGDLRRGALCRIKVKDREALALLRGSNSVGVIKIDGSIREKLDVRKGASYDFQLESCNMVDEFVWMWRASDPAYRISGKLGLISFFLGIVSLVLAVPTFVDWLSEKMHRVPAAAHIQQPVTSQPGSSSASSRAPSPAASAPASHAVLTRPSSAVPSAASAAATPASSPSK